MSNQINNIIQTLNNGKTQGAKYQVKFLPNGLEKVVLLWDGYKDLHLVQTIGTGDQQEFVYQLNIGETCLFSYQDQYQYLFENTKTGKDLIDYVKTFLD